MTICPKVLQYVPEFTPTRAIRQTTEVAVKGEFRRLNGCEGTRAIGSERRMDPTRTSAANPNTTPVTPIDLGAVLSFTLRRIERWRGRQILGVLKTRSAMRLFYTILRGLGQGTNAGQGRFRPYLTMPIPRRGQHCAYPKPPTPVAVQRNTSDSTRGPWSAVGQRGSQHGRR